MSKCSASCRRRARLPLESHKRVVDNPSKFNSRWSRISGVCIRDPGWQMTSWLASTLLALTGPLLYAQSGDGVEFFEKKIRPLLVENCYACHSAKTIASGGLKLDTKESVLKGGSRGTALVPGSPDASLMLRAVRHEDDELKMPPTGRLSDSQIEDLRPLDRSGRAGSADRQRTTSGVRSRLG